MFEKQKSDTLTNSSRINENSMQVVLAPCMIEWTVRIGVVEILDGIERKICRLSVYTSMFTFLNR